MKVGYIRVSTEEQNLARQKKLMETFGVERTYADKLSGKNTDREQFQEMLSYVREGDVIYVESFSRLSRSTRDLLKTVDILQEKGVRLVSDKEKLDTDTPQGRFMLTVFAALSELERESILQRQKEGIAIAKAQGKYKGRKPGEVPKSWFKIAGKWCRGELKLHEAIEASGVSEATFFRRCKKYGITKESYRNTLG